MKRILILIHVLFCGYICPLLAEDTGAARYQDSILKVADTLPATLVRLTYLRDMAYKHQYAPYNMTFSTRLYEEARRQKNAFYENMGAYYLAACYDKKHDPDSLSYWVDVLKDFVPPGRHLRLLSGAEGCHQPRPGFQETDRESGVCG